VAGGAIPREFIPACDKGFKEAIKKGSLIGFPVVKVRCVINDGLSHAVDSSEQALQDRGADGIPGGLREGQAGDPGADHERRGAGARGVPGRGGRQLNQRRGIIQNTETVEGYLIASAHVPLSEMFGYSTDLRSATQGKGEYSMEFAKYQPVPRATQEQMIKEFREKQAAAKK